MLIVLQMEASTDPKRLVSSAVFSLTPKNRHSRHISPERSPCHTWYDTYFKLFLPKARKETANVEKR